ncbi:MAG: helix-turn-helix transcriptional regulator [Dehalococcoidia bacterium]|nr:helix-turn-helix transcriptional regulator [Dehalococcoidia bacterium]
MTRNTTRQRIDWTPRQREVLGLLAHGRTNPEIAAELGISLDGAKWHVGEVMGRLGVDRREDAAAYWVRENRLIVRFGRRARQALSVAGLRWALGAAGAVLLAVAAVALVVFATNRGGEDETPAATVTATAITSTATTVPVTTTATPPPASPSPTATPEPPLRPGVTRLAIAPDTDLPEGLGLVVATSGYGHGHGGFWQVEQLFRLPGGATRLESLLAYGESATGIDEPGNHTGIVSNEDSSLTWLSRCQGIDTCNWEGPKPDATTVFLRSTDGGVTWEEALRLPGEWWVRAAAGDVAYAVNFDGAETVSAVIPSGRAIAMPPGDGGAVPYVTPGGLAWPDFGRSTLVDASGTVLADSGLDWLRVSGYLATPQGEIFTGFDDAGQYLHIPGRGTWRTSAAGAIYPFQWLDQDRLLVSAEYYDRPCAQVNPFGFGIAPAIVDVATGSIAWLGQFFDVPHCGGARSVVAATTATARVNTPGECLNLRSEPETGAVLTCAAHGVLLQATGESRTAGGREWVELALPGAPDRTGWASAEFLER